MKLKTIKITHKDLIKNLQKWEDVYAEFLMIDEFKKQLMTSSAHFFLEQQKNGFIHFGVKSQEGRSLCFYSGEALEIWSFMRGLQCAYHYHANYEKERSENEA